MKHLEDVQMNYWEHFWRAYQNVIKLVLAAMVLAVHAWIPNLFQKTASKIIKGILQSIPHSRDRILVRFNTKWEQDAQKRQWRVLVNGTEELAHRVIMEVPCETIEEPINGEMKFHFLCFGTTLWNNFDSEYWNNSDWERVQVRIQ